MRSTIRLFRALPIKEKGTKDTNMRMLQKTLRRGFVFSPEVIFNYPENELLDIIKVIEKEIGLTPEQMNNTFQKSWKKVRNAPRMQLVIEQLIHYLTTYGFEQLGIYDEDSVYVPSGDLDIPGLTEDVRLVVIKGYTMDELREKLIALLNTGIALAEETKNDIINVAVLTNIQPDDINSIKNREVRTVLYEYFELVPEDPVEFLRYLVFKATGSTLLIKNKETYEAIGTTAVRNPFIVKAMNMYHVEHGLDRLAEIFYRFKPLFLALRANDNLKPIINRVRRLAVIYHEPMQKDYLNEITAMVSRGEHVKTERLLNELEGATIFRKIRLAQALNYRTIDDVTSIMYKVRNGKAFATEFSVSDELEQLDDILTLVRHSIVVDVRKNVEGRKIFIPENIDYTMPATEKQFTGNLPSGTCVTVEKNMVFGVHWENQGGNRIDLDLSLISAEGVKIGWDGSYRNRAKTALFSGDLTDAQLPHGASELFYMDEADESHYILFLNYFNFDPSIPVPFKILVAREQISTFEQNHMVDPNNIRCVTGSKMNVKQKVLGLIATTPTEIKFYFNESALGRRITSSRLEYARHARKYLFDYSMNTISLNDILAEAGAEIIDDRSEAEIDLSPETLEKDTIIKLLTAS